MKKLDISKQVAEQERGYRRFMRKHKHLKRKNKVIPSAIAIVPKSLRRASRGCQLSTVQSQQLSRSQLISMYLPVNLKYMMYTKTSPLYINNIKEMKSHLTSGVIPVPKHFSIFDNPNESYQMLRKLIFALLYTNYKHVILDYKNCDTIDLCSQILLDIIFKESHKFVTKIGNIYGRKTANLFPEGIGGKNIDNERVQKMLFSVGSPANVAGRDITFPNTKKCKLCVHSKTSGRNAEVIMAYKDIATTELADYVIECLRSVNKELTPERLDDLCIVIGETLINAEEHSTTGYRYSVGYFDEMEEDNKHFGIFRLVILNFGHTIYEKFKDKDCPNQEFVAQMKSLSEQYTKSNFFVKREFEEESLWTLYALQQGVTSVSTDEYTQRGNGSINFIKSFFNLKGDGEMDNVSRLRIASGRTRIIFDGAYKIQPRVINGESFEVMTFNKENDIRYKPDKNYVYGTDYYFPGTAISVKIMLNDDDIKQIN